MRRTRKGQRLAAAAVNNDRDVVGACRDNDDDDAKRRARASAGARALAFCAAHEESGSRLVDAA